MTGNELLSAIVDAEDHLSTHAKELAKIKRALHSAGQQLRDNPRSIKILQKLLIALQASPQASPIVTLGKLSGDVESVIEKLASGVGHEFRNELTAKARQCSVACFAKPELMTVGPFELIIDQKKECAGLHYAKAPVATSLPIDVDKILAAARKLMADVLDAPVELGKLASELEEAVVVSLARKRVSVRSAELRAELPMVHREMTFIRQGGKKEFSKRDFREYPLARFVFEVATLVRSDENIAADKSFRLETAVIENAGNRRRSIFIPKKLSEGYGEGMYYQAVVLRQPT